jgi:hypothetical protein
VELRLRQFEEKIEEYYLSCMPSINALPDKSFLTQWPLQRFSICRLYEAVAGHLSPDVARKVADKLVDVKLHFAYQLTVNEHFYRGATLIVGNNELENLNPNTISLLRAIHYRVYLLTVLIEQVLNLLWLMAHGEMATFRKNKWAKIIQSVHLRTAQAIVTDTDAALLLSFNERYRTAELHKYSAVRGLTGKGEWTHLQEEEQAVIRLLSNIYSYFTRSPSAAA